MEIDVKGNTKEQILQGIEPWKEAKINIDLSALSTEARRLVAEGYRPTVIERTPETVQTALEVEVARLAAKVTEETERIAANDAAMRTGILDSRLDTEEAIERVSGVDVIWMQAVIKMGEYHYPLSKEARAELEACESNLRAERDAQNASAKAAAILAAQPQIDAAIEAKKQAEAEAKAEKQAALAVKLARRAETGTIEIKITRGYIGEWGTPWGAVITTSRGKDSYDFDAGQYDLGNEILTITCEPGDVIAYGQKNYRKPKRTMHERRRVESDWRMVAAGSRK